MSTATHQPDRPTGQTFSLVKTRDLVQGYQGRPKVISGLNVEIDHGVVGLLGPNGAGKTTLLRTLATAAKPRSGTLELLGRDPSRPRELREIRRRLGFLPQSFGYFPNFSVQEFVEYSAWLREVPRREIPERARAALESVDLGAERHTKMRRLSGGLLRRAGIAQALVNEPELLILDEPTAGLDPEQRVDFRALLRRCGERGVVIVATHLVEDVATACGNVLIMLAGRVMFRGPPSELASAETGVTGVGDTPIERGYSAVLRAGRRPTS